MTENTVNVPLLRKAVEWAEVEAMRPANERQWIQSTWMSRRRRAAPGCGTAYCIAGWTLHAAGWTDEEINGNDTDVAVEAGRLLGIDGAAFYDDAEHLFDGSNTITDVRRIAESLAGERL